MRVVVGLIAFYLLLDFSDPGIPGAFNFEAEESVEVVQVQKIDLTKPALLVEPGVLPTPTDTRGASTAGVVKPVAVWATLASGPRRRTLLRPHFKNPTSEEASPASLAV